MRCEVVFSGTGQKPGRTIGLTGEDRVSGCRGNGARKSGGMHAPIAGDPGPGAGGIRPEDSFVKAAKIQTTSPRASVCPFTRDDRPGGLGEAKI